MLLKSLLQYSLLLFDRAIALSECEYGLYLFDGTRGFPLAMHNTFEIRQPLPLVISKGASHLPEHLTDICQVGRSGRGVSSHTLHIKIFFWLV
jgi:hypothetical protein